MGPRNLGEGGKSKDARQSVAEMRYSLPPTPKDC